MSLVSVIIPYFQKKKFIKQTIKSIIKQTYKNFEVLIIYDDENLSDYNYIKSLIKIDKRFKIINPKKKLGAGPARNLGIKISKGKYLAFCDSDDCWHKEKLKIQIKKMKNKNISFTFTSYNIVNYKNKIIKKRRAQRLLSFNDLIESCDIGLSTVVLEKKILKKNNYFANMKTKEDFVFWLKISQKGINFYGIDKLLVNWRKLDDSLSSSTLQKIYDGFNVYYKYMNYGFLKSLYYLFLLSINYLKKN